MIKKDFFKGLKEKITARKDKIKLKDEEKKLGKEVDKLDQLTDTIKEEQQPGPVKIEEQQSTELKSPTPEGKQGLSDKVDDITEKIDMMIDKQKLKKGKPFQLPFGVRKQLNTLAQKDKVLVLLLKTNRDLEPVTAKIKNGYIEVNGKFYECSTAFIYLWMHKFPCIVLPEWSLNPIGTTDYFDAVKEKRIADPQDVIIRAIENKETLEKGKMPGKMVWWILIVGIILAYVLFGSG